MANIEHLKLLKSGVDKWNEVMDKSSGADLRGADLRRADLRRADLRRADLYKADLRGADLSEASLSGANLHGADLSESNLLEDKLLAHFLRIAELNIAKQLAANLSGANLSGTNLHGANLSGVNLSGAFLWNADLRSADLSRADLRSADLRYANLSETIFNDSNIGSTIFGLTDLSTCIGLETVNVNSDCTIDFQTLRASKNIPKSFLLKIGLPELFIDYLPDFYMDSLTFYPAFLSHSTKNKPFARKLYEALIAKGVNVFIDEKKMKPGDDIYESLSKGISYYDKMILVCSKESLTESWWVDRELDRVLAKERQLKKERGERINLLIPITIDQHIFSWDGAKAEEVRRYIIGDFTEWEDETKFEKALNDLIHALNINRPDIKPPSFL